MTEMFGGEPVFRVDMNSLRDGTRINALLTHATSFPVLPRVEVGQWVKVLDEEGNTAFAIIDRIDGIEGERPDRPPRLRLKVDMDSWTSVHVAASWQPAPFDARTVKVYV